MRTGRGSHEVLVRLHFKKSLNSNVKIIIFLFELFGRNYIDLTRILKDFLFCHRSPDGGPSFKLYAYIYIHIYTRIYVYVYDHKRVWERYEKNIRLQIYQK